MVDKKNAQTMKHTEKKCQIAGGKSNEMETAMKDLKSNRFFFNIYYIIYTHKRQKKQNNEKNKIKTMFILQKFKVRHALLYTCNYGILYAHVNKSVLNLLSGANILDYKKTSNSY